MITTTCMAFARVASRASFQTTVKRDALRLGEDCGEIIYWAAFSTLKSRSQKKMHNSKRLCFFNLLSFLWNKGFPTNKN